MRARGIAFLGLGIALIALLGIAIAAPPTEDFNIENPLWNGMSELGSRIKPLKVSNLAALHLLATEPSGSALLLLGPSEPFTSEEINAVRRFLEAGGLAILADDFGTGNDLLRGLDVKARFSGMALLDPLFKHKDPRMPRLIDFTASPYTRGLSALTLNHATVLTGIGNGVRVLAYSTPFSYLAKDLDTPPEGAEAKGPFPVIAEVRYGKGVLVLVSDSSLFINSMLDMDDNYALLRNFIEGRAVYIDASHWKPSRLTQFKTLLTSIYGFTNIAEVKYGLAALLMLLIFKVSFRGGGQGKEGDEVEDVLREHPEWEREILERLKSLRDEYGVS